VIDPDLFATEIMAQLGTLTVVDIFEGGVPDKYSPPMIPGSTQIKPYVIVDFSGITEPHNNVNGIVGATYDSFDLMFSCHSVASTLKTARTTNKLVVSKLLGFIPSNSGEVRPAFFGGIGANSNAADPSRYSVAQAFRAMLNSAN
jgi:hypothetical protein